MAESSQMSGGGRIDRVCSEHKKPAMKAAAIARAAHCEVTPRATIPLYNAKSKANRCYRGHCRAIKDLAPALSLPSCSFFFQDDSHIYYLSQSFQIKDL